MTATTPSSTTTATTQIIVCESCFCRLRLPATTKQLVVRCPRCGYRFLHRTYAFGLSTSSRRPAKAGVAAGILAAALYEAIHRAVGTPLTSTDGLVQSTILTCVIGAALGAVLGAADGYFRNDADRIRVGAALGLAPGLISGVLAGALGWSVFALLLRPAESVAGAWVTIVLARVVTWTVIGALVGAGLGLKDNTLGDLRAGFRGGAFGGALGGLVFDGIAHMLPMGDGIIARIVGFSILGAAISIVTARLREIAIREDREQMYQPISTRLPVNPRLLLPPGSGRDAKTLD